MDIIVVLVCFGLLYWWAKGHAKIHHEKLLERREKCPHPPDMQQTLRVNSILTINPALIHKVLPGRRWLVKHCRVCGKQWPMYSGTHQPWNDYKAEYDQETIDRKAQYEARKQAHANEEKERRLKREREQREINARNGESRPGDE